MSCASQEGGFLAMLLSLSGSQVQQEWSRLQLWTPQLWDHMSNLFLQRSSGRGDEPIC